MSKKRTSAEETKAREAEVARRKAVGHTLVVLPGGKRRMMTTAEFERWAAARRGA